MPKPNAHDLRLKVKLSAYVRARRAALKTVDGGVDRSPDTSKKTDGIPCQCPFQRVRMPPIRNKNARNSIEIEGRLELAISAFKNEEISSIREAACLFDVPCSTLAYRLKDRPARVNLHTNSHKLTEPEENQLVQWVLDLDKQELPPRPAFVENMANHIYISYYSGSIIATSFQPLLGV
ncbi:conserved hypothetical protein [Coccidioides posadasii str. Silveira]|uniref:HTH psq-type domain-containing protein n=1 Tax=Coccidioides posadasii (strain RMSCC 757 / Silveira) TaxID=443226 RepID=E9CUI4_COCPS|nr:conserved hypothetical protein [Coccidioides posadasii str. Silveira]